MARHDIKQGSVGEVQQSISLLRVRQYQRGMGGGPPQNSPTRNNIILPTLIIT